MQVERFVVDDVLLTELVDRVRRDRDRCDRVCDCDQSALQDEDEVERNSEDEYDRALQVEDECERDSEGERVALEEVDR